jgi:hypothetical protein
MDKIIAVSSTNASWNYECFGPAGSTILTCSQTEARFWHAIGYVVLHVTKWA